MTTQQKALRTAAVFLKLQSLGAKTYPGQSKIISDLCFLALPMKYRLGKPEIAELQRMVKNEKGEGK